MCTYILFLSIIKKKIIEIKGGVLKEFRGWCNYGRKRQDMEKNK